MKCIQHTILAVVENVDELDLIPTLQEHATYSWE